MVKVLDREAINRMVGGRSSITGSGGGGGSDIDLTGYATKSWTDENYVGKEFFSSLFKAYDSNGNEVLPNDTETVIDNIKAMFGFWTEFYVSALGTGGQQSVGLRLAQLADVNVAGVQNDQVLKYDATSQKWVPSTPQAGTDMATVWSNLAASGNQQINYSHLSGAVSLSNGTITIGSSSVTPITSSDISDMATKTWVGNQGTAAYAKLLSSDKNNGKSSWAWNPFNLTQAWCWGQRFKDTNIGSDSGDIRFYLAALTESDGVGLGMNIDGPIATLSKLYVGSESSLHDKVTIDVTAYPSIQLNTSASECSIYYYSSSLSQGWAAGLGAWSANGWAVGCYSGTGSSEWKMIIGTDGVTSVRTGLYSYGFVTCISDERKKDVVGEVDLTVEQIAKARTVIFRWKDKRDNELHMGCIAQDWQNLTPQLVHDRNDELSMEYSVIAAIGTIKNSQRLVNHETRLRRLEKMFALNENDIEE